MSPPRKSSGRLGGGRPPDEAPPTTIAAVISRMEAIMQPLDPRDGVACFTGLYLTVTRRVQSQLAQQAFADRRFLGELDVSFANLFFTAVQAAQADPAELPHAWAPLFEARTRSGIAPLQFALAGMNAHINRDLPVALVSCCTEAGLSLAEDTPEHADFQRVNQLLAAVEAQVKEQYLGGWSSRLDRLIHRIHRIDDVVAMWDIRRARDAAWTNAQALWALRDDRQLAGRYLDTLDRTVGFAGRGLLIPADTWLRRLYERL